MSVFEAPLVRKEVKRRRKPVDGCQHNEADLATTTSTPIDDDIQSVESDGSGETSCAPQISGTGEPKRKSLKYQHIDVLVTIVHKCVLEAQWDRAYRAFSMLLRCKQIDLRLCHEIGLQILDHIDPSGAKSEEFLGRLIVAYPPLKPRKGKRDFDRADLFVRILTRHRIEHKQYDKALNDLESWLLIPPYKDDMTLWKDYMHISESLASSAAAVGDKKQARLFKEKRHRAQARLDGRDNIAMDIDD